MEVITLSNEQLSISISTLGAELQSIWHHGRHQELLWQGDNRFWGRKAPVLFPFVGRFKDDTYHYSGHSYGMGQHGFARDREFEVLHARKEEALFSLQSDEESLQHYPFHFELQLGYRLEGNRLISSYRVSNKGADELYFSIGAHPGFFVPVAENGALNEISIRFEQEEQLQRHLLTSGLQNGRHLDMSPQPTTELPLHHGLFELDAIIFKHLKSSFLSLCHKEQPLIRLSLEGFPYLGIWTKVGAPYICLEPWCGLADSVAGQDDIQQKEGINRLDAGGVFERTFSLEFF
jgi:galactose mutarotase-like enzyme